MSGGQEKFGGSVHCPAEFQKEKPKTQTQNEYTEPSADVNYFYRLPARIAQNPNLTPAAKLVFAVLNTSIGKNDTCWPSLTALAAKTGLARRTVVSAIQELEKSSLITALRAGKGKKNQYQIGVQTEPEAVQNLHQSDGQSSAKNAPVRKSNWCKKCTTTGAKFALPPVQNLHQLPNITVKDNTKDNIIPPYIPPKEEKKNGLLFAEAKPHQLEPKTQKTVSPEEFAEYWNTFASLPPIHKMSEPRRRKLQTRMNDNEFKANWKEIIRKLAASPFHTGQNKSGWRATVDWLLANDTNWLKILEQAAIPGLKEFTVEEMQELLKGTRDDGKK